MGFIKSIYTFNINKDKGMGFSPHAGYNFIKFI